MKRTALGVLSVLLVVFLFFGYSEHDAYAGSCGSFLFCEEGGERHASYNLTRNGVSFACDLYFLEAYLHKISIRNSSFGLGFRCWPDYSENPIFPKMVCRQYGKRVDIDLAGPFKSTFGEVENCYKLFDVSIFNDK